MCTSSRFSVGLLLLSLIALVSCSNPSPPPPAGCRRHRSLRSQLHL